MESMDKHIHFVLLGPPAAKDWRYSSTQKQHRKQSVGRKSLSYILYTRKGTDCIPTIVCLSFLVCKVKIWVENPKSKESLMKLILLKMTVIFRALWGCRKEPSRQAFIHLAGMGRQKSFLVDSAPVAAIAWHEPSSDEQYKIDEPPDPKSSKCQQLPNCRSSVSQTEAIHSKASQEEGIE